MDVNQATSDLEQAARILLAPPNLVTNDQRNESERIYLEFRKLRTPYQLCRHILDNSAVDLVLFEAAGLLKESLVREWKTVPDSDVNFWCQYLFGYVIGKPALSAFVREKILQIVAIIVKRKSVDDAGETRAQILEHVQSMIGSGDPSMQIIGCSVISAIIQEYANTVKSSDVGLRWEIHLKTKKDFETSDLKKIFKFCISALSALIENIPNQPDKNVYTLLSRLLAITESVLSWSFVPAIGFGKKLVGIFEAEQNPTLKPGPQWTDIFTEMDIPEIFFKIHWKLRSYPDLSHHTVNCLTQMASLNGPVVSNCEARLNWLRKFVNPFLGFLGSVEVLEREAVGIASIFRRLVYNHTCDAVNQLAPDEVKLFVQRFVQLTTQFCVQSMQEEVQDTAEDHLFSEAFELMLNGWEFMGCDNLIPSEMKVEIFDTFLRCHLSLPEGLRPPASSLNTTEEIEEISENDRIQFKDQLSAIGHFGRMVPEHSLKTLSALLESRTSQFNQRLQQIHSNLEGSADMTDLGEIYEDIHWILLVVGNVLCMNGDGDLVLIPPEVNNRSLTGAKRVHVETSLKILTSPGNKRSDVIGYEAADDVICLVASIFRLADVERHASDAGMAQLLSPELGTTLMWCLSRWVQAYLGSCESDMYQLSPAMNAAFRLDGETASWIVGFLLNKVESNLRTQPAEQELVAETVLLLVALVGSRDKQLLVVKSGAFWSLVRLYLSPEMSQLSSASRKGFFKGLTMAGAGHKRRQEGREESEDYYLKQVPKVLQERFSDVVRSPNFSSVVNEEAVRSGIVLTLESLSGVVQGCQLTSVTSIFSIIRLLLPDLVIVLDKGHNYTLLVESVLDFLINCAKSMLHFLSDKGSHEFYSAALEAMRTYAKHRKGRLSGEKHAEEEFFSDLTLLMDLLLNLLTKDMLDMGFSEPSANDDLSEKVSASTVCLNGLFIVMPLLSLELLRFPSLCQQFFKMITYISEIHTEKIFELPPDTMGQILSSIEIGLTTYGPDITSLCCDFLQAVALYMVRRGMKDSPFHQAASHFLKLMLDLIISGKISSELMTTASSALYALICAYQNEYQKLVESLLSVQEDPDCAEKLAAAFNDLTKNVRLGADHMGRIKFRDNFETFLVEVRSVLVVK